MVTIGRGDRQADRAVEVIARPVDARSGRGFREAPRLRQHVAGHLLPALGDGALHGHAATQADAQTAEVEAVETLGVQQRVEQRVDARKKREAVTAEFLDEAGEVARVRNQDVVRAELDHRQAVRRQREDVIQGQRRDRDQRLVQLQFRADPRFGLQHVRDEIAVREHGALRHTSGAAGVLQERDVLMVEFDAFEVLITPLAQRLDEADGPGQAVLRYLLLHVPQREIDDGGLRETEQVAHAGDDHGVEFQAAVNFRKRVREVLEDHQRPCTRVVQLVLQLARRVHRVGVDDRQSRAKRAQDHDGVLQHVRQHDRDAVALAQSRDLLQVGRKPRRQGVDVTVGQRAVHAGEARTVAMLRDGLLDHLEQRAVLRRIDVGRYAGRIVLQPDLFQVESPGSFAAAVSWPR